jgi:hypothetical protein
MYEQYYSGYSNALEKFPEEFNLRWAAHLQAGRIAAFLRRNGAQIEAIAPGVAGMIERGLASLPADPRAAFDWLWCPEPSLLPLTREPLTPLAPLSRAAALALHFASLGIEGEWRIAFDQPGGLRFDHWFLADILGAELVAESDRGYLTLTTRLGDRERLEWRRGPIGWTLVAGSRAPSPVIEWGGAKIMIMPLQRGQATRDAEIVPVDPAMEPNIRAGLELIAETSPAYVEWVARLLRFIVPLSPTPGMFRNASNPNCCSCVMMTIHPDAPRIGETFVHEASHQYFDLLESFTPLLNGNETREFWSPPRRENRPLRGILIAYHAFVNCLVYYQLQMAKGMYPPSDFGRTFDELVDWKDQMEVHLAGTDGLTAAGTELWLRLRERASLLDLMAA